MRSLRLLHPKGVIRSQLLEAKDGLQRMLVEIALTDEERAAAQGDRRAIDGLITRLANLSTPADASPNGTRATRTETL